MCHFYHTPKNNNAPTIISFWCLQSSTPSHMITHLKQVKRHTWPSSMSLCMPGLSCSVLLVLLMERLCDLRFCLTWRAAALFPLSTGITPQWRPPTRFLPETEQTDDRFVPSHWKITCRLFIAEEPIRGFDRVFYVLNDFLLFQ